MASTVQPLRVCLRACRRTPVPQRGFSAAPRIRLQTPPAAARRAFSTTQRRPAFEEEEEEDDEIASDRPLTEAELQAMEKLKVQWDKMPPLVQQNMDRTINSIESEARAAIATPRMDMRRKFWNEDEEDTDLITDELDEDMFDEDDIMGIAHNKLEEFREYRAYARLAAWELPLLSKLARPFEPPTAEEPLRFRYTTYMGEFHPAENKVVVEFCPKDLPLNEAQQLKIKKLLGPRYNPETDIAKMSCEQFEHQAQNKRYLGDVINSLVEKAKDPTDMFEDIALDTRHHTFKVRPKFPKEWRMTEERRKFIDATREKALLTDKTKEEKGILIDGPAKIEQFLQSAALESQFATQRSNRPGANRLLRRL